MGPGSNYWPSRAALARVGLSRWERRTANRAWPPLLSDRAVEHLHFDGFAGGDVAYQRAEDDEAVGLRHRRQDAGALVAGDRDAVAAVGFHDKNPALEFGAARSLL